MSKLTDTIKAALASTDSWTGPDKLLHLGAGFATALVVAIFTDEYVGLAAGVSIGAGKEMYDAANSDTHTVSGKDFTITAIGAVIGSVVGHYIRAV